MLSAEWPIPALHRAGSLTRARRFSTLVHGGLWRGRIAATFRAAAEFDDAKTYRYTLVFCGGTFR
jgi:hypothetical protein